ncbi:MAG: DUF177 domain-containing protein [Clostridia bacterium]|nr:DUF177 domain-containing protein [Clostridia bacterium]
MVLDVSQAFLRPGERIAFRHEEPIPPQLIFGETVTFPAPAVMTGDFLLEGSTLYLTGTLEVTAQGRCAYCLSDVSYPVSKDFAEVFLHLDRMTRQTQRVADDDEQMTFEGKEIDLAQLALTLTVLELPMRFECENCSEESDEEEVGHESRACQKETPTEHPFSALQQLLTKDQEV